MSIKYKIKTSLIHFLKRLAKTAPIFRPLLKLITLKSYNFETRGVAAGILAFESKKGNANNSSLRRNIHRIEKGLITTPMKPIFANDYIIKTVNDLKHELEYGEDSETLEWAYSILTLYFNQVEKTANVTTAQNIFSSLNDNKNHSITLLKANERKKANVTFEDLLALNKRRRSIRYYTSEKVNRKTIEDVLKLATQAPSACNRQSFSFQIYDDKQEVSNVAKHLWGATTFANNINCLIFIIGDLSGFEKERDRHTIYIDSGLVAMNILLALETVDLSSCIINCPEIPDQELGLKRAMKLNDFERPVLCMSIGHAAPEAKFPSSRKRNINNLIKYN